MSFQNLKNHGSKWKRNRREDFVWKIETEIQFMAIKLIRNWLLAIGDYNQPSIAHDQLTIGKFIACLFCTLRSETMDGV